MIYPNFLKKNGCIGVPAPSGGASSDDKKHRFNNAIKRFQDMNYKLVVSLNIFNSNRGRSASKKIRAEEINSMFKNKDIDIILCAAGGDFLVEILPYVDFNLLLDNPKYVLGFSDPTGLLYTITTRYDIATIYGHNFSSFGASILHKSEEDFLEIIHGNLITQHSYDMYEGEYKKRITGLEGYNLTDKVYWMTLDNKKASVNGRIIGGCFDIILELAGTKYDGINNFNEKYKDDGIIWYFDNCEISMEGVIRGLWKLNELGYFKYTKGIIFGRFGTNTTCYDYDVKSCLMDSVISKLNIPIIYDADISHKGPSFTIINGSIADINVEDGKGTIKFNLD